MDRERRSLSDLRGRPRGMDVSTCLVDRVFRLPACFRRSVRLDFRSTPRSLGSSTWWISKNDCWICQPALLRPSYVEHLLPFTSDVSYVAVWYVHTEA